MSIFYIASFPVKTSIQNKSHLNNKTTIFKYKSVEDLAPFRMLIEYPSSISHYFLTYDIAGFI
jgi:hypothetical protein